MDDDCEAKPVIVMSELMSGPTPNVFIAAAYWCRVRFPQSHSIAIARPSTSPVLKLALTTGNPNGAATT